MYLSRFRFADVLKEELFINYTRRTCYETFYPFGVLSAHHLKQIDLEPITILYGHNGSGKSTALNIICEKLGLQRDTLYNRTNFYEDYLKLCEYETEQAIPRQSRMITSDDVFDFMLNLRCINNGIDVKREELFEDYLDNKYSHFRMRSLDDYEALKKVKQARSTTQSAYVRQNLMGNVREHSNGESAFIYFNDKIKENALYLLDEPENSLSTDKQLELKEFIQNSARFFGCQFIIATHSPFILSLKGARIYDLDEETVDIKKWTELGSVRAYYELFAEHKEEFE
ncbi:MAG: AAA family ATPase [Lachnospiraceae bacterium]|nr:AAA family ATPase [Lachnospiraceae bacterium]